MVEIRSFFNTVDLLPPGVVPSPLWRPELAQVEPLPEVQPLAGTGRKP
jgi:hypothetical protein